MTDASTVDIRDASADVDATAHVDVATSDANALDVVSRDADATADVDALSSDAVASLDADPMTVEGFCALTAAAATAQQNSCGLYPSFDLEGYLPISLCPYIVAGVHHGRTLFDPARAVACLATYAIVDCKLTSGAVCSQVYTPQVADGGACDPLGVSQCAVGSFCKGAIDGCGGTCTPLRPQGGVCSGNDLCAGGQMCNYQSQTCELYGTANAACGGGSPQCDYLDACVGGSPDGGTAGVCQPLTVDGPCTPDGTGGGCIPGKAYCPGPGASHCIAFKPTGVACTKNIDCDGWCTPAGTCAALLEPIGAACGTIAGTEVGCVLGAFCNPTTQLCQRLVPVGAACTNDLECGGDLQSARCDSTTHLCVLPCPPL
ncbi:MAG TPA: hypothetical protein VH560_04820 [Polyangia bacterium]|nr:hypothetical protein [Polyangia bacterium]